MTDTTSTIVRGAPDGIASELELLKTDALGRVKVPAAKRELILNVFERSGLSGQAFSKHIGVKYCKRYAERPLIVLVSAFLS